VLELAMLFEVTLRSALAALMPESDAVKLMADSCGIWWSGGLS
jgi:hypothetical protein